MRVFAGPVTGITAKRGGGIVRILCENRAFPASGKEFRILGPCASCFPPVALSYSYIRVE
jgi:hypothetical protein